MAPKTETNKRVIVVRSLAGKLSIGVTGERHSSFKLRPATGRNDSILATALAQQFAADVDLKIEREVARVADFGASKMAGFH